MKKFLLFFLLFVSLFAFISCDSEMEDEVTESEVTISIDNQSDSRAIVSYAKDAYYFEVFVDDNEKCSMRFECETEAKNGGKLKFNSKNSKVVVKAYNKEGKIVGLGECSLKGANNLDKLDIHVYAVKKSTEKENLEITVEGYNSNVVMKLDDFTTATNLDTKYVFSDIELGDHVLSVCVENNVCYKTVVRYEGYEIKVPMTIVDLGSGKYEVKTKAASTDSTIGVVAGSHFRVNEHLQMEIEDWNHIVDADGTEPEIEVYFAGFDTNSFAHFSTNGAKSTSNMYIQQYNQVEKDYRMNVVISRVPADIKGWHTMSVLITYGANRDKYWSIERNFYIYDDSETDDFFDDTYYEHDDAYVCPYCKKSHSFTTLDDRYICDGCGKALMLYDTRPYDVNGSVGGVYKIDETSDEVNALLSYLNEVFPGKNIVAEDFELYIPTNYEDVFCKKMVINNSSLTYVSNGGTNGHTSKYLFFSVPLKNENYLLVKLDNFDGEKICCSFFKCKTKNEISMENYLGQKDITFVRKSRSEWFEY